MTTNEYAQTLFDVMAGTATDIAEAATVDVQGALASFRAFNMIWSTCFALANGRLLGAEAREEWHRI